MKEQHYLKRRKVKFMNGNSQTEELIKTMTEKIITSKLIKELVKKDFTENERHLFLAAFVGGDDEERLLGILERNKFPDFPEGDKFFYLKKIIAANLLNIYRNNIKEVMIVNE